MPCNFEFVDLDTCYSYIDEYDVLKPIKTTYWEWYADVNDDDIVTIHTWKIGSEKPIIFSDITQRTSKDDTHRTKYYRGNKETYVRYKKILDSNFSTIHEGFIDWFDCSYNKSKYFFAGDMSDFAMFRSEEIYDGFKYPSYFNYKGEVIIPCSRKYQQIIPQEIDNQCFYLVKVMDGICAILDNKGTELFRFPSKELRSAYCHTNPILTDYYKERYVAEIYARQWFPSSPGIDMETGKDDGSMQILTYDTELGFGIIEPRKDFPGGTWDEEKAWRVRYNFHPKILWTHIMLPSNSRTFNVSPSNNHSKAKVVDLQKIATPK